MSIILKEVDETVIYRLDLDNWGLTISGKKEVPILLIDAKDPNVFENALLYANKGDSDETIEKAADAYAARYIRLKAKYPPQEVLS